jgi:hypothetical protein
MHQKRFGSNNMQRRDGNWMKLRDKMRRWARNCTAGIGVVVCAVGLGASAQAQTWLPAPPKVPCETPATRFQPNPVDTSQTLRIHTGGGQNGKLVEYYTELTGNEFRLHFRTVEVLMPLRECYSFFFNPNFAPIGTYALVYYEYGARGGGQGFQTTPNIYGGELFSVVAPPSPAPVNSGYALAALVMACIVVSRRKLRALIPIVLLHMITPPMRVSYLAQTRNELRTARQ